MSERLRRLRMRLPRWHKAAGSWSVCSTVAEAPEMLYAFVAHYLELGAEQVHLFIDDPDQPGLDRLRDIKGVRLTICTQAYWNNLNGGRPEGQVMRQIKNANVAYQLCPTRWFFFCDADEFFVSDCAVSDLLAAQPAHVTHCRTRMAERAFPSETPQEGLFDGMLRLPLVRGGDVLKAVYGDLAGMTTRGLLGHVIGKSFVRAGNPLLRMRIHFPVSEEVANERRPGHRKKPDKGPELDGGWLVHFDGMTPLHWKVKLLRYYLSYAPKLKAGDTKVFSQRTVARSEQLNTIYQAQGDPDVLARLTPLIRPDADMLAQLVQAGGILDRVVDPAATARRRVNPALDFSAQVFDAKLRARHGDLISKYRLEG